MSELQELSGLRQPFGQAAWRRVLDLERCLSPFSDKVYSIWERFGINGLHLLGPYDQVLGAIIDEILPVMDKNNESDCYTVCMLIRHLALDSVSSERQEKIAHVQGKGDTFQGLQKLALVTLLQENNVKGTVLERYLSFPLTLPAVYGRRTDLFSIA